jgi:hypothetical protein
LADAVLAAGTQCTFSVDVTGVGRGDQSNTLTVTANESGPGDTSIVSLKVELPLAYYAQIYWWVIALMLVPIVVMAIRRGRR